MQTPETYHLEMRTSMSMVEPFRKRKDPSLTPAKKLVSVAKVSSATKPRTTQNNWVAQLLSRKMIYNGYNGYAAGINDLSTGNLTTMDTYGYATSILDMH